MAFPVPWNPLVKRTPRRHELVGILRCRSNEYAKCGCISTVVRCYQSQPSVLRSSRPGVRTQRVTLGNLTNISVIPSGSVTCISQAPRFAAGLASDRRLRLDQLGLGSLRGCAPAATAPGPREWSGSPPGQFEQ